MLLYRLGLVEWSKLRILSILFRVLPESRLCGRGKGSGRSDTGGEGESSLHGSNNNSIAITKL